MSIHYEWVLEDIDQHGDIQNVDHSKTLKNHFKNWFFKKHLDEEVVSQDLGIVRDEINGGRGDRSWAYLTMIGNEIYLPTHFEDAYGIKTARVPAKFFTELAKCKEKYVLNWS